MCFTTALNKRNPKNSEEKSVSFVPVSIAPVCTLWFEWKTVQIRECFLRSVFPLPILCVTIKTRVTIQVWLKHTSDRSQQNNRGYDAPGSWMIDITVITPSPLLSSIEKVYSDLCACVCVYSSSGPTDGNLHWSLSALHAEHPGRYSFSASHLDRWYSRNPRVLCNRLHVLYMCEFFCKSNYSTYWLLADNK